ncbi:MAG: hypothetical protein HOO06_07640 [Bdellovibrionaceae bacterium]|nr:hypothetical protein [Pseudobdellovibrionaceae bacterium]
MSVMRLRKVLIVIVVAWFTVGCSSTSLKDFKAERASNGSWIAVHKGNSGLRSGSLRDQEGKLVQSEEDAIKLINKKKSFKNLKEDISIDQCGYYAGQGYQIGLKLAEAVEHIKNNENKRAEASLNQLFAICENVKYQTSYSYLKAMVLSRNDQVEEAKKYLREFINLSDSLYINGFYKEDVYVHEEFVQAQLESHKVLKAYKIQAEKYLSNNLDVLTLELVVTKEFQPRMGLNDPFSPGGSKIKQAMPYVIATGNIHETMFGVGYYYSDGNWTLNPLLFLSTYSGTYTGFVVKKSIYQSYLRDLNLSLVTYINQAKLVRYTYMQYSPTTIASAKIIESGYDYGVGIGATKRFFRSNFGISGELTLGEETFTKNLSVKKSAYVTYTTPKLGLEYFAGVLKDDLAAGISLLWLNLGYNFDQDRILVQTRGLGF